MVLFCLLFIGKLCDECGQVRLCDERLTASSRAAMHELAHHLVYYLVCYLVCHFFHRLVTLLVHIMTIS